MADDGYSIKIPDFRLTYKDLFVFKPLYRVSHKWFVENSWQDMYGRVGLLALFYETYYIHRETGGGFYDISILWDWYKPYMDAQFTMKIQVEFILLGGRIEERRIDDKKVKGESGELSVFLRPSVSISDADFNKNIILRRSKKRLFERTHRGISEEIQTYTYSKAKEVFDTLKSYLDSHGSVFGMDTLIHRKWEGV